MKYWSLFSLVVLLNTSVLANENRGEARERIEPKGFLYGLGIAINQEIYKGYNYSVIPLPVIGYRGDNFRVIGPFVSYDVYQLSDFEITLQASPRFQSFDQSDSYIFENMDERKFSMDAGLGLSYEKDDWKIGVSAMFDVLNRSNGYEAKANISRVFRQGPLFFEPSLSINYLNTNHVDYYYGVNVNEINQYTAPYEGKSAVNTTLGFSIATPIFLKGFTRLSIDYTWYGDTISNSPLIEDHTNISARFLFSKYF
tara:strand:- start:1891 stop:2655 length:765 start_codon:yes stop_codon:yes gene_type:complete